MTDDTETTLRLLGTTDSQVWAEEFVRLHAGTDAAADLGLMIGWFANAIETGRGVATHAEPTLPGVELIAAERRRQIKAEGWTPEHDDEHDGFELSAAARCYTLAAEASRYGTNNITFNGYRPGERINSRSDWPWPPEFWKPSDDPVRNLVKAGALIAAEIDRLQRAAS